MSNGPLSGLTVIDLTRSHAGAFATQTLADGGADVLLVEPPEGIALRELPGWPSLGRGKDSVIVDLRSEVGGRSLDDLLRTADVLVTSARPATLARLGLTARRLSDLNPRLVSAAITGFGADGPHADLKAYEGVVMAKLGFCHVKRMVTERPGPAFISAPYASWGAAQAAVQGVLAALYERESSGLGQHIETDLVRGAHALDTWQWFTELVGLRWPDAYTVVEAFDDEGQVQAPLIYPLTIAPTIDGTWLQFAQVQPRLFLALMHELGLGELLTDPKWAGLPVLPTQELRTELWELMIRKVGERSRAEWEATFGRCSDVFAEAFRSGRDVLDHPQLRHDRRSVRVEDPGLGPVLQPSGMAHAGGGPLVPLRPAPALGERRASRHPETVAAPAAQDSPATAPLSGVTVLELGVMFAAPFGATLLADLGARVIKVEPLEGDTIRRIQPFPESGGAKVLQGKESIAVDLGTAEGRTILRQLIAKADVVLQGFRAGAAERAGAGESAVAEINPSAIYVNAPGYGTDGPYGDKPAYAPSIGAASGLVLTDAPHAITGGTSIEDLKHTVIRLMSGGTTVPLQADGLAALGVATTMLLGLVGRARGKRPEPLTTTMLGTLALVLQDHTTSYAGKPELPTVDADYLGTGALYRLYEAADGWVFLAAPAHAEWADLTRALAPYAAWEDDARFSSPALRSENDGDLADLLAKVFATRPAAAWERDLRAAGIGCVEVHQGQPQHLLLTDADMSERYTTTVRGPIFDDYPRLNPLMTFSRSPTPVRSFPLTGQDTDTILDELGYDAAAIADLHDRKVVTS